MVYCMLFVIYVFVVNTHVHADHVTGSGMLKKLLPGCQSLISKDSGAEADILICSSDVVQFGNHCLTVHSTPGHTNGQCTEIAS